MHFDENNKVLTQGAALILAQPLVVIPDSFERDYQRGSSWNEISAAHLSNVVRKAQATQSNENRAHKK